MKASELRIGNWVYEYIPPNAEVRQVWSIKPDTRNHEMINEVEIEAIGPIPITKEWLEKFGFKTYNNAVILSTENFEIEWFPDSKIMSLMPTDGCTRGHMIDVECEHVHQLQNLYFSLTGKEL